MQHIYISNIADYEGQEVTLHGWVYNIRSIGKIWFMIFRDGTGLIQCVVVRSEVDQAIFELEAKLTQESSVSVTGIVRKDDR
ncbi:MAG: asparagine--tRNA ligase, partial [Candidatus Marinimicrobia bacterium]|nr:asparagine--tRNA ligase [Candidatus Neomarinimicrobiota bacterium]